MENAADALKMAAAALIFIIAIASSFSLFGTAKQTADSIIGMRDKQQYLDAADLDTILYTSSATIQSGNVSGCTVFGDRKVGIDDVISTIYRYSKEKYGVTIVKSNGVNNGTVIARFDSNTESVMRQYNNIESGLEEYKKILEQNTKTNYTSPKFTEGGLENVYKITDNGNRSTKYGAPWYGNDEEIQKRINVNIYGGTYTNNTQSYTISKANSLLTLLKNKTIIEVINEIDQSEYLQDNGEKTNLLQQYQMPTVEIIYII